MIHEEQTYTMAVGKAELLVQAYQAEGLDILRRSLGELAAFWVVDVGGDIDQIIQVWSFDSHEDRARRRAALLADPAWQAFAAEYGYLITKRTMRVLRPVDFSPLQ